MPVCPCSTAIGTVEFIDHTRITWNIQKSHSALRLISDITHLQNTSINQFWCTTTFLYVHVVRYTTTISQTLNFSKTLITRNKSRFPWIRFTVILPPIFRTPDFSNQFLFPLEVREIGIPLYSLYTSKHIIAQHLVTTSSSYQVVFITNCDVRDLWLMSSQSRKKTAILAGPDLHQTVISTLHAIITFSKNLLVYYLPLVCSGWKSSIKLRFLFVSTKFRWLI